MEEKIKDILTLNRLEKYSYNGDSGLILKRYGINLELCSIFYISLHSLEIALRNKIYQKLAKDFGDEWLINDGVLKERERFRIEQARKQIENDRRAFTIPRLIAELSFGFWEHLFANVYEDLWRESLHGGMLT